MDGNQLPLHQQVFGVNLRRELCPGLSWVCRQSGLVDWGGGGRGRPRLAFPAAIYISREPMVPKQAQRLPAAMPLRNATLYSFKHHKGKGSARPPWN